MDKEKMKRDGMIENKKTFLQSVKRAFAAVALAVLALAASDLAPAQDKPATKSRNLEIYWMHASVARDGGFTITKGRNGFSRTYVAR